MSKSSLSRMPELQAAVRALAGVGSASIAWPEPAGPATLRIELEPGADRAEVTTSVLDALEGIGGADLSSMHVALPPPPVTVPPATVPPATAPSATAIPEPPPARNGSPSPDEAGAATNGRAAERPAFEGIILQRTALDVAVTVVLTYGGRRLTGEAEGLATRQAIPRVAAAATLAAVRALLPSGMRLQVDWVAVHDGAHPQRPPVVQVAVAVLSSAGEQVLVGSAIVRDDVRDTAARATLDALNRRLTGSP